MGGRLSFRCRINPCCLLKDYFPPLHTLFLFSFFQNKNFTNNNFFDFIWNWQILHKLIICSKRKNNVLTLIWGWNIISISHDTRPTTYLTITIQTSTNAQVQHHQSRQYTHNYPTPTHTPPMHRPILGPACPSTQPQAHGW